jgi:hypothetical protein
MLAVQNQNCQWRRKIFCLDPGDGLLYKGCERPHWRDPLPSRHKGGILGRWKRRNDNTYYHQIFFHYVLADGIVLTVQMMLRGNHV